MLSFDNQYASIIEYLVVFSLVLGILQLALKQLESILQLVSSSFSPPERADTKANWIASATPWFISAVLTTTILFVPDLELWLSCSASFSVLIVHQFCTRSLKLSDSGPATRVYLSISLVLVMSLALQLIYLAVSSGLENRIIVTAISLVILLLHLLQTAPLVPVLINKLRKTGGSALAELNKL